MIIRFFVYLYVIYAASTIVHEIGHYLAAKILLGKVIQVVIGLESFSITIGKLKLSPIIFGGHVEVDADAIMEKSKIGIAAFVMSGIAANILLVLISVFFMKGFFGLLTLVINITIIIFNSVPLFGTDVAIILNLFVKK